MGGHYQRSVISVKNKTDYNTEQVNIKLIIIQMKQEQERENKVWDNGKESDFNAKGSLLSAKS